MNLLNSQSYDEIYVSDIYIDNIYPNSGNNTTVNSDLIVTGNLEVTNDVLFNGTQSLISLSQYTSIVSSELVSLSQYTTRVIVDPYTIILGDAFDETWPEYNGSIIFRSRTYPGTFRITYADEAFQIVDQNNIRYFECSSFMDSAVVNRRLYVTNDVYTLGTNFYVDHNSSSDLRIGFNNLSLTRTGRFSFNQPNEIVYTEATNNPIIIKSQNTNTLFIRNGRVGVATSPAMSGSIIFDVNGNSRIQGDLELLNGTMRTNTIESLGNTLSLGSSVNTSKINIGCGSSIQSINLGSDSTIGETTINIGGQGDIVNIAGTLNYIQATNLQVDDKLITLNKGSSGLSTARNAGIQIRDNNNDDQAYIKTSTNGDYWMFKAPENNNYVLSSPILTQNEEIALKSKTVDLTSNQTISGDKRFNNNIQAYNIFLGDEWDNIEPENTGYLRFRSNVWPDSFNMAYKDNVFELTDNYGKKFIECSSDGFQMFLYQRRFLLDDFGVYSYGYDFFVDHDSSNDRKIGFNNNLLPNKISRFSFNDNNQIYHNSNTDSPIIIKSQNTDTLYIRNGRVGIGTNPSMSGSVIFDVNGQSTFRGNINITAANTNTTISPLGRLFLNGNSTNNPLIYLSNASTNTYYSIIAGNSNFEVLRTGGLNPGFGIYGNDLKFYTDVGQHLNIKGNDGFCGIRNNSPQFALDVIGEINCTDGYLLNGNALSTDNIIEASNLYFTNERVRNALFVSSPLTYNSSSGLFGINQANTSTNGFLSSVDWNTFNNKISSSVVSGSTFNTSNSIPRQIDNRSINPSLVPKSYSFIGFGSFNDNGNSPWADNIILNTWADSSGGNMNVLSLNKNDFGMRIFQAAQSDTALTNYRNVIIDDASGNIASKTTDNLTEGTTNKYYTDTRARQSISANNNGLTYNNSTGIFSLATANSTTTGALSNTDWNTFNNKVSSQWITNTTNIYYNSGNVGIGTSDPTTKLHICNGNIAVENTGTNFANVGVDFKNFTSANNRTNTANIFLKSGPGDRSLQFYNYTSDLASDDTSYKFLARNTTEILTIKNNGNVGIGNNSPNAPLQFANSVANRKIVLYQDANNDHQFYGIGINAFTLRHQVPLTSGFFSYYAGTSSTTSNELMRLLGVGILSVNNIPSTTFNSSLTTSKLVIGGDLSFKGHNRSIMHNLYFSNGWKYINGSEYGFVQKLETNGDYIFLNSPNNGVADGTAGLAERIRIKQNGNIGINNNNPQNFLDIARDTRSNTHPTGLALYATEATSVQTESIVEFRHSNATQGIGFGWNSINAVGDNANVEISLRSKGNEKVRFWTNGSERAFIDGSGNFEMNVGAKFPTSGGTKSVLDYYEEYSQTFTFTNTGVTNANTVTCRIIRIGKMVSLTIDPIEFDTGASTIYSVNTNTSTIPSRFRPASSFCQLVRMRGSTGVDYGSFVVQTSGRLNLDLINTTYPLNTVDVGTECSSSICYNLN